MRPLRTPLPRRTLLRGAGAALALPWLEAMSWGDAQRGDAPSDPLRYVCLFAPNGMLPSAWRPEGEVEQLPLLPKSDVAAQLFDRIEKLLRGRS